MSDQIVINIANYSDADLDTDLYNKLCHFSNKTLLLLLFFLSISLPYPYYISLVSNLITSENLKNSSVIFKLFMTSINCVPLLSFISYYYFFVINKKYYNVSDVSSEYIKKLNNKFNIYVIVVVIWSLISWIMYIVWSSIFIFPDICSDPHNIIFNNQTVSVGSYPVCGLFIVLNLTSLIRFSLPIVITFIFCFECDKMILYNKLWFLSHGINNDVVNCSTYLKNNIENVKYNAKKWQYVFLFLFIIPVLSMLLLFISSLFYESIISIIDNQWVFWIYCVHYSLIGFICFYKATRVKISHYKDNLLGLFLIKKINFINNEYYVDKYFEYIEKIYSGFSIFGLPMTTSTLSSFCVVVIGVISWLLDYIL